MKHQYADTYKQELENPDLESLHDELAFLRTVLVATPDVLAGSDQDKVAASLQVIESIGRTVTRMVQNQSGSTPPV